MQWEDTNARLAPLKSSTKLVTNAERQAVEKAFSDAMDHWAKRKRMFKAIWFVSLLLRGTPAELC